MHILNVNGKILNLENPVVMGIVNITPDSFYSDSRMQDINTILTNVEKMISQGASIIDIGAFTSRPHAKLIPLEEELSRLAPVFKSITKEFPDTVFSIDTFRSEVIRQMADISGFIVNDISGFSLDENLLATVAEYNLPYILMHIKGNPENMMHNTDYDDLIFDILNYFGRKLSLLRQAGIPQIIIDPGIGFAKNIKQNFEIINKLSVFNIFEYPVMIGLSRKSFIYKTLKITPEEALNGSTAMHMAALLHGVKLLRVHDVKAAVESIHLHQMLMENVND